MHTYIDTYQCMYIFFADTDIAIGTDIHTYRQYVHYLQSIHMQYTQMCVYM